MSKVIAVIADHTTPKIGGGGRAYTLDQRDYKGAQVIVLESNQNHAIAEDTEVCPTLPASMGMGGGYVPMIVVDEDREESIRLHDKE